MRRLLFGLLAAGFGLLMALVVVEVVIRIWDPLRLPAEDLRGFYRLDAEGRIETTPGWQGTQVVEGRTIAINMNSLGLRGPEISPRAAGEKRILMIGDSYVWGMGVEDDATFPARIEQALRDKGQLVRVGNAGMYGTGPREWGRTVERYRASFDPDLVIACLYVGNDILDTLQEPLSVVDGWLMNSGPAGVARTSWRFRMMITFRIWNYIERMLNNRLESIAMASVKPIGPGIRLDEAMFLDRDPARDAELPFIGEVEALLAGWFAEFADACEGVGAMVVLLPGHEVALKDYGKLLEAYKLLGEGEPDVNLYERGRGHARLRRLLEAQGLEVIDLADRILGYPARESLFFVQDWHYSPKGCRQVAAWLVPEVEKRLR